MNLRDGELLAIKNKAVPQWLDKVIDEDFDRVILIVGKEGVGKSTLAILLGYLITEERNKKLGIDRPFEIETNISYDLKKLKRQVFKDSVSGDVRIIDESAITGGYKRDAMGRMNRLLNKTLMTCRSRNQILLFLIPDINEVESYVRKRCHSIIRVVGRGHAWIYGVDELGKIGWDIKKRQVVFRRKARYHLERYRTVEDMLSKDIWNRYIQHKETSLSEEYDETDDEPEVIIPKNFLSKQQILKQFSVSEKQWKNYLKNKETITRKTRGGQHRVNPEDFERWLYDE